MSNAQTLAGRLIERGAELVTGGTDNHLIVVNTVASFGLEGREAQQALEEVGLATNKQLVPDDTLSAQRASGIRLGTPAPTTRGMGEAEMIAVADLSVRALRNKDDAGEVKAVRAQVLELCSRFPAPGPLLPAPACGKEWARKEPGGNPPGSFRARGGDLRTLSAVDPPGNIGDR